MNLSKRKFEKVRKDFEFDYLKPPYASYINGTGLVSFKELKNSGQNIKLKKGESLDDLCLHVTLSKTPPSNLNLPDLYKNIRVFYELIGEIELE